jgi:hypothetical protein
MKVRAILTIVMLLPLALADCGDGDPPVCYIDWSVQPVWDLDTLAVAQEIEVHGVWGANPNHVYAAGTMDTGQGPMGVVWEYDGTAWSELFARPNADFRDIHGVSPQSLWIAAIDQPGSFPGNALVLHWDGAMWHESLLDPSVAGLTAIWAADDQEVYAAGRQHGVIVRYDGTNWSEEDTPVLDYPPITLSNRSDIWGIQQGSELIVYAGLASGTNVLGTVLRKGRQDWEVDFQVPDLGYGSIIVGVWAGSSGEVYALEQTGRGQAPVGRVWSRADTAWTLANPPFYAAELVNAIRGDQSGNVVVLGPRIYYLSQDAWVKYDTYPGAGLASLRDHWLMNEHIFVGGRTSYSTAGVVLHGDFSEGCSDRY